MDFDVPPSSAHPGVQDRTQYCRGYGLGYRPPQLSGRTRLRLGGRGCGADGNSRPQASSSTSPAGTAGSGSGSCGSARSCCMTITSAPSSGAAGRRPALLLPSAVEVGGSVEGGGVVGAVVGVVATSAARGANRMISDGYQSSQ